MAIKKTITEYKQRLSDSINNKRPFRMIRCAPTCGCVRGIKWEDGFELNGQTLTSRNGYRYRLSVNLANQLENMFLPLIQPKLLGQTWGDRVIF